MPRLVRLDAQRTKLGDAALATLAKAKPQHLARLNLYGTQVTDKGLEALPWPALTDLYVSETKVTEPAATALRHRHPTLHVRYGAWHRPVR